MIMRTGGTTLVDRLDAEEWRRLTAADRWKRCRLMAHEESLSARSAANEKIKRLHLELALQWEKLAREIARESTRQHHPPD
jgi:hypothetical protein